MNPTNTILYAFLIVILLSIQQSTGYIQIPDDRKCKYIRTNKLLKGRCYDMNLKEIPQYLSTSIEILDVSFNRIKKLKRTSFQKYNGIKYLLLYENMIQSIEPDTFVNLNLLEEIDLSNNALTSIPLEIFQLPSLRNLYVDSNDLFNLPQDLQMLEKPIKAPLGYLNMADCGLHDIPNLGILPYLWHLNVSLNPLDNVNVERLMPMCHLKSFDFKSTNMPICACHTVSNYLELRGLNLSNRLTCDKIEQNSCPESLNITLRSSEYYACVAKILDDTAKFTWLTVLLGIGGFLVFFICILYCCHRRNVRRAQLDKMKNIKLSRESGNQELLRNTT